jgi:hypothetical protein
MAFALRYKILFAVFLFAAIYLYLIHQKLQSNTEGVFNLVHAIYDGLHHFILFVWIPLLSLLGMGIGIILKCEEVRFGFMYASIGTSIFYLLAMIIY